MKQVLYAFVLVTSTISAECSAKESRSYPRTEVNLVEASQKRSPRPGYLPKKPSILNLDPFLGHKPETDPTKINPDDTTYCFQIGLINYYSNSRCNEIVQRQVWKYYEKNEQSLHQSLNKRVAAHLFTPK
jgi:hypothetical protein